MRESAIYTVDAALIQYMMMLMVTTPVLVPGDSLHTNSAVFAAKASYFLLDVDDAGDIETLITQQLGQLLRQLNHVTEQRQVENYGQVRGRITWPSTFKARYSRGYDPNRYICREVHNWYDRPENQLMKYLVACIATGIKAIPQPLRTGITYFPQQQHPTPLRSAERLAGIETALALIQRNPRFQRISLPHQVTHEHILAAENAPLDEYRAIARMYRRYQSIVMAPHWQGVIRIGQRVLLLPTSISDEAAPWARLATAILAGLIHTPALDKP